MGEDFSRIEFEKHRLHEKRAVHGTYPINDTTYVSICSGEGSYGDLNKIEYHIFLSQQHGKWFNNIKSSFEIALVTEGKINDEEILSNQTPTNVEEFIKKVKQR